MRDENTHFFEYFGQLTENWLQIGEHFHKTSRYILRAISFIDLKHFSVEAALFAIKKCTFVKFHGKLCIIFVIFIESRAKALDFFAI